MTAVMISTMVLCFALTVSVAVSIGLAAILAGIQVANVNMLISVKEMFNSINKFPLAAIPFFILAGNLMETGGISRRLVEFAKSIVGGVQGGLPMTCVLTCMIFAAVSGLLGRHHVRHRRDPDPGADQARLSGDLCRGAAGHQRRAGRDHSAVHSDDPVRRQRRSVDRRAVHRRLRPGPADRRRADAVRLPLLQVEGLGQERRRRPPALRQGHAAGRLGAGDAGDHPGRHLRRHLHARPRPPPWRCSTP